MLLYSALLPFPAGNRGRVQHKAWMSLHVQLNVIPVMFYCASGASGWRRRDAAVGKAGLADVSLARLGWPFAALGTQKRKSKINVIY